MMNRTASRLSVCLFISIPVILAAGCSRESGYSQEKPDDVVKTAFKMVENGEASKLPRLIYADSREFRSVLNRLGKLMGSLQELGKEVAIRFPNDVKRIKAQVVEQATGDGAVKLAETLANATADGKPSSAAPAAPAAKLPIATDRRARAQQEDRFRDIAQKLFADPFSWLAEAKGRITTELIADDRAAVLLDGKPVPPLGLSMRKADGRWFIELPLNFPGISGYVPQTFNEWSIIGSLMKVIDNAVGELTVDLRNGQVTRMDQLAEKAGEKAFIPAAMVFVAYSKEMDVRTKRERVVRDFRKRISEWTRAARDSGSDADVVRAFGDAVNKVAVEEIDKLVRARIANPASKVPSFADLTEVDFNAAVESWFGAIKAPIALSPRPSEADMSAATAAVNNLRRSTNAVAPARKP